MKKCLAWGGGAAAVFVIFTVVGPALISAKDDFAVLGGFALVGAAVAVVGIGIKILVGDENDQ